MPIGRLSSGERVRMALAKALIENPDLLLLDEPTNHLDQQMVAFLEEMLGSRDGATVIVSHDRKFLNRVCNRLVDLHNGHLSWYGGNYDFYRAEREREFVRQRAAYEAEVEERAELKEKIKAMTFSRKIPPPPRDGNMMAYNAHGEMHQRSLKRTLDTLKARLEEIESAPLENPRPKTIKGLKFVPTPLGAPVAIELTSVSRAFGERKLFRDFSKILSPGDRIVLTGPNGCGKTTLLECIAGVQAFDSGTIRRAPSVKIAYLDQEVARLPIDETPIRYFESRFRLTEEALRRELHMAAIGGGELLFRPFSTMSVGQKKRFMLLTLILEKPNVLLLDEPTNHLDFMTLEAFEKALLEFEGAILAVSHDATFIGKIATQMWTF